MLRKALYHDTYDGPRWRYGLVHRPITSYFNVPGLPDPIIKSNLPDSRYPYHGVADWPEPIPEEEARHHSLVLVAAPIHTRDDGWPCCPVCGEDELAVLEVPPPPTYTWSLREYLEHELFCYRCARVTVPAGVALASIGHHIALGGSEPD
jgi:hypothetical protein